MSHRMLRPVASAAAVVMLMAACTSSPTATPRPTQTSVQATAAATTQATSAATTAATTDAEATVDATAQTQSVPTEEATAEAQAATEEATVETALTTSEAPVGTTVAMATVEATEVAVEATEEAVEPTVEATEVAVEPTVEATEVAVEPTEEAVEPTVEATEVAVEPTVEATVEAGTPVAMATVEVTEVAVEPTVEAVEPTVEATEVAVEPTVEATEAVATAEATTAATAEPTMEVVIVTTEPTAEATVPSGPQTFTDSDLSDGGMTFVYPEGFVLTGGDKQAILTAPDGGVLNVYAPDTFAQVIGGETFTSDADTLAFFVDRIGLGPDAEPTAEATAEAGATVEPAATVEAADLVKGELARTEAVLERRDQAGVAYLVDLDGGAQAVVIWLTATGTEPSAALVEGLTLVTDTLAYTPPPPPPTEEPVVVEPTVEATAAATAEAAATTEAEVAATAEAPAATAEATSAAAMPATVVEVAMGNSDFTTLVNAVVAAELVPALSDSTASYTVFAPTNEAFAAALESMGMTADELLSDANRETLVAILQYHVIPSTILSSDLVAGDVETLQGESVTITVEGGKVMVNDANVVTADIESGNGVVHVIDKVLVPPTLQ